MQKAIQRAEKSGGDPLAYLPEETQKYVPAILGAGFGVKRAASSPWSQQPKYVDPGFNKAIEHEALQDAADESPVSTSLERGWEGLKHNAGLFLDNVTDDSQGAAERIKAKREWDDANPAPRSSTKFVEQFQQLALDVPREHARLYDPQMRLAVEFVQKFLFRRRKIVNISFECVHNI